MRVKDSYLAGLKDGIPIFLGYVTVSLTFGMRICMQGFPVWLAALVSATNLTSAGQFAATNLMLQHAPVIEIATVTLVVNMRYFLMSIALSQKFIPDYKLHNRLLTAHGVTDEIFALAVSRPGFVAPQYMYGLITMPLIGWTLGTILGGIFTQILPQSIVSAMGLALYAMFIAIIIPPALKDKAIAITVAAATLLSILMTYISFFSGISEGWRIIIIAVLVPAVVAVFFPVKDEEEVAPND